MPFTRVIWFEVVFFLSGLAAIIFYRLLTGGINTKGLLYSKQIKGAPHLSPERVQLLLFTLGTAMLYLLDVLENRNSGKLPDIPIKTLAMLGGSHAIYLGGKAYSMLLKKIVKGE